MMKYAALKLDAENGERPSIYWGYVMYGILMEKFSAKFAKELHEQSLKPISQYIMPLKADGAVWRLNFLSKEAIEEAAPVIKEMEMTGCRSSGKSLSFKLSNLELSETVSSKDFCRKFLTVENPSKSMLIRFITPCSFKSDEQYCIFPSAELLLKSAVNKWNAFSDDFVMHDEDAFKELAKRTKITRYELKSVAYHVKGAVVPSFMGTVVLSIKGPDPLLRIFNLLISYLEYCGAGVKTALGMGGCEVERLE